MNNGELLPILQDKADYMSNFHLRQGGGSFFSAIQDCKICPQETKHRPIVWCRKYFDVFNRLGVQTRLTNVTDGRTDGLAHSIMLQFAMLRSQKCELTAV